MLNILGRAGGVVTGVPVINPGSLGSSHFFRVSVGRAGLGDSPLEVGTGFKEENVVGLGEEVCLEGVPEGMALL